MDTPGPRSDLRDAVNIIVRPIVQHLREVDSVDMVRTLWIEGQLSHLLFMANQEPDPVVDSKRRLQELINENLNRRD